MPKRTPLAQLPSDPPPPQGLATLVRLPTLVRSKMLSHARARPQWPTEVCTGSVLARPRAARRLLQPNRSASTTVDDPNSAHRIGSRPPIQLFSRMAAAMTLEPLPCSRGASHPARGQPSVNGPGIESRRSPAFVDTTPHCAIARVRELCPAPRGLGHLMLRTRDATDWSYLRHARAPLPAPVASSP